MTDTPETAFIDYWDAVDRELRRHFAIDSWDAGIEPETIASAQEDDWTPQEFALWFGEKYDLTRLTKADWTAD